tara:strand:- start:44 stop:865 length:822 start_codon:yes stop_codon:yes gene_type:complete
MTDLKKDRFLIIGAGNMGMSFVTALLRNKYSANKIIILENKPSKKLLKIKKEKKLTVIKNIKYLKKYQKPNIALLSVKPNQLNSVFDGDLIDFLKSSLIISIIAGKKLSILKKVTKNNLGTVRAMTNTPVSVGMGTSILFFDKKTPSILKKKAYQFLGLVGQVSEVKKESLIDPFTAIFGSGPAYIYYFIETLSKIAKKHGLENSNNMVLQLFLGSLLLMLNENESPESLRQKVTSKGGTTEAAMLSLTKSDKFNKILLEAINKAKKKSKELN